MQDQIMTRKEAKRLGLRTYHSLDPCKHNHPPIRYARNGTCVQCQRGFNKAARQKTDETSLTQGSVMSKRQAQRLGLHRYRSLEPCKYGHEPRRYARNGACVQCTRDHNKASRQKTAAEARGLTIVKYRVHPDDKKALDDTVRFLNGARGLI